MNWKYITIIIIGLLANLLFIQWNKTEVKALKSENSQTIQISTDSLFNIIDKAFEDSKCDKNKQQLEIAQLKDKVKQEQSKLNMTNQQINDLVNKTKSFNYNTETINNNDRPKLMASGIDYSSLEKELVKKEETINILKKVNHKLNQEIDSLKYIIESGK